MSAPPDHAVAGHTSASIPAGQLPAEIWEKVIVKLRNDDLKRVRLVSTTFNDFAIPPLFRSVCFSLVPESHTRLLALSKKEKISRHVERLYLDTTSYNPTSSSTTYTKAMSNKFADALAVPRSLFRSGPLSGDNLLKVLRTDSTLPVSESCLSGKPRTHFLIGYGQYCARGDFQLEKLQADGIYKSLVKLLPCFKRLNHVETITSWTLADDFGQKFESYLYHSLPESTFKLIPGLRKYSVSRISNDPKICGEFVAPAVAARRLNFMGAEALPSSCWDSEMVHEMVSAALRALQDTKIQLNSLSLPGSDYIGYTPAPRSRKGMVTVPPLCTVLAAPDAEKKTLLLPLFQHLKKLELQIDHSHPGTRSMLRYHFNWSRLPRALQSLVNVHSLSIGYKIQACPHDDDCIGPMEPMSLYRTLLFQEEDQSHVDNDNENQDEDDQDPIIPTELLNAFSFMFGIPPPPPPTGAASVAGTQQTNDAQPASSYSGSDATPQPPAQASTTIPMFAMGQGPNGLLFPLSNPTTGLGTTSKSRTKFPAPSAPLSPNPWPKLKHLKLWNMPARNTDVIRLFQTIGLNLRSLEMHNIYYDELTAEEIDLDDEGDPGFDDMPPLEDITNDPPRWKPSVNPKLTEGEANVDAWYETIEALGSVPLSLSACKIEIEGKDWAHLYDTLCRRVQGWEDSAVDIGDALSTYLLESKSENRAMGFAMHVAEMIKTYEDENDSWLDEDDDEDDYEDDDEDDGSQGE